MPAPKSKAEVQDYAKSHNLEEKLSTAVNAPIASGSPDPIAYIAQLLSQQTSSTLVDYAAVRAELKACMDNPSWDDGSLAPTFIRLAWHSSGTFHKSSGTGGSNGAGMRFDKRQTIRRTGLNAARSFLEPIKRKFPPSRIPICGSSPPTSALSTRAGLPSSSRRDAWTTPTIPRQRTHPMAGCLPPKNTSSLAWETTASPKAGKTSASTSEMRCVR